MTSTEILLTVLFSPVVLLFARAVRPREDIARSKLARAVGIIGLLPTAGAFWIEFEASRTVLLLLSALVVPLSALPVSEWSRTLLRVGLVQVPFLACFILLLALGSGLFSESYRATRTGISPDGRWEFRCPGEYDTHLSVAPRGLSTWDLRAYPSRVVAYFGSGAGPDAIAWTGPREITATWNRGGAESHIVPGALGFRVLVRTRGEGITPAGTPSRAASPRPR